MNLQWAKTFVELVKAGAPLKAYQKKLGLNKEGVQTHLAKLAEYEASLKPRKTEVKKQKPIEYAKKKEVEKAYKKVSDERKTVLKKLAEPEKKEEKKDKKEKDKAS